MSEGIISLGTTLGVSASLPASHDSTGFAALTFTESGEVTNFGSLGTIRQIAEFLTLHDGTTHKRVGGLSLIHI